MGYLPVNDFVGHDNKLYRDLGVDATPNDIMLVWVRRRLIDGKYFLVTSVIGGHALRKEISVEEALLIYHEMRSKIPYRDAFCSLSVLKKAHAAARKAAKAKAARTPDSSGEEN